MKIIIVGAGIAGLTLAAACQRVGIHVKLYDKATQLQPIGGGLLLWPHSIRYLDWLGLGDCLKPYYVKVKGCRVLSLSGQTIFSEIYDSLYAAIGGEILPIDRSLLQHTLLSILKDDVLTLGKTCIDVKSTTNEAQIFFTDGTQDSADIIVGADGIHSVIRKHIHPDASLEYTNHCWWGGIVEQKYVPDLSPDESFMALGLGKLCIAWPAHDERFMWYLPVKMSEDQLIRSTDGTAQLQQICADWIPEVQQLISAPAHSQRFHLPIYTLPPQSTWSTDRITLIGDAAHALGPVLGQGANQAIEDVFVLINCLQHTSGNIADALNSYESLRHGKSQRLFTLENQSVDAMINDDMESLTAFQAQLPQLKLLNFYQELIPLVNERFCVTLASIVGMNTEDLSAVA